MESYVLTVVLHFFIFYTLFWCFFTVLEYYFPAQQQKAVEAPVLKAEIANGLFNGLFSEGIFLSINILLLLLLQALHTPQHILAHTFEAMPLWGQVLLGLFFLDTIQYVRHRVTHRFFWNFHTIHHAAQQLRSSVHWRMHPVDYLIAHSFQLVFLYIIGFTGEALLYAVMVSAVHNMWLHTNVNVSYPGFLKYIFVSPNYHKWHHAKAKEAVDKNFADIFVGLDLIGGTRYDPPYMPEKYGVLQSDAEALHADIVENFVYPFRKMYKRYRKNKNTEITSLNSTTSPPK